MIGAFKQAQVVKITEPVPELEIIRFFPTVEPTDPEVGEIWYRNEKDAVWWNGSQWL